MASTISGDNGLVAPVGAVYNGIQSQTAKTATGTAVDFTGIPSWVKRITVMFGGISTSGTSNPLIQIGDSSGVKVTGYSASACAAVSGSASLGATYTTGFGIAHNTAAAVGIGLMTISKLDGNTWAASHSYGFAANSACSSGGGYVTLSGTLDRIRITTVNGTDTFDAGSINILYE